MSHRCFTRLMSTFLYNPTRFALPNLCILYNDSRTRPHCACIDCRFSAKNVSITLNLGFSARLQLLSALKLFVRW